MQNVSESQNQIPLDMNFQSKEYMPEYNLLAQVLHPH